MFKELALRIKINQLSRTMGTQSNGFEDMEDYEFFKAFICSFLLLSNN